MRNTEKCKTFSVPITKEGKRIGKNREEIDNLAEGIHTIKCKYGYDNTRCETCRIKYKYYECYLQYINMI